ncbi:MAG: hypothetical protein HWN65_23100 [Candidatus Helarchaeota archaeon]|nr:hypothetical protein [Candidatus Helarchaeota archaeon]
MPLNWQIGEFQIIMTRCPKCGRQFNVKYFTNRVEDTEFVICPYPPCRQLLEVSPKLQTGT